MEPIRDDTLLNICNKLDPILKTLSCFKEMMERAGPAALVDDYFNILVAFERINEAKERLGKIVEKKKVDSIVDSSSVKIEFACPAGMTIQR